MRHNAIMTGHGTGSPAAKRLASPRAINPAILLLLLLGIAPAQGETREVSGQAGYLGEWEIAATVSDRVADGARELFGLVTMRHVGMCSQDGPEEKSGEIRLRLSDRAPQLRATLTIDGVACSVSASLADAYKGAMSCPDRRGVPLTLWIR
jgi:hypothetical protein